MKSRELLPSRLYLLVFLAGFSFLVYEVSWFRILALYTGATVKASTIVLSAYMAGFGAGAWFWGRAAVKRMRHYSLLLALLPAIAVSGMAITLLIPETGALIGKITTSRPLYEAGVMVLSLILLLIPAFFMGGVLPLAAGLLIRDDEKMERLMGRIYAWETLGSTLGGLVAGFILIRFLGQMNTVVLAASVNLAATAYLAVFNTGSLTQASETPFKEAKEKPDPKARHSRMPGEAAIPEKTAALIAAVVFGFAIMGLQIAWFRIFRIYLTNTSYTFSIISSAVILGLFAGSRYFSRKRSGTHSVTTLIKAAAAAALATAAGAFLLYYLPEILMFPLAGDRDAFAMRILVIPLLSALLIVLPPAFISGYAFPLACSLYAGGHRNISRGIGKVMLFNTIGSIAGPLLSAFVLIPWKGAGLSVLFFAFSLMLAAFLLLRMQNKPQAARFRMLTAGTAALLALAALAAPPVNILPPSFTRYQREVVEYRETAEGTWVIGREPGGSGTALSTYVNNSAVIGSSYDAIKVVKMVGHLPFYSGLECRDVLVVGFGIGVTTSAIASHPEVKHIDCVELVAGLKDAARYYSGLNNSVHLDPRLRVIPGDGRQYLQAAGKTYDLISSDPTHPILGSGSLYTLEYFELCRSRLNPGGMVSQYLPLHKLLPEDFAGIIKTFHSVFPNSTVWLGHNHAVLLGSEQERKIDFAKWSETVQASAADPYFYKNPYHLAACLVLDGADIESLSKSIRINTDDRPLTEFFRLSSFRDDNIVRNLEFLNNKREAVYRTFSRIPDRAEMDRYIKGNRLLTEGLISDFEGNRRMLIRKLMEAASVNPGNEEYPFLIKFYSGTR